MGYALQDTGYDIEDFFTLEPLPQLNELPLDSNEITSKNTDGEILSQILINAKDTFFIIHGGTIDTDTLGKGDAGKIQIIANTVIMYDAGFSGIGQSNSSGNAGDVVFNAERMSVQNGGGGVNTNASGNGGNINIVSQDLVVAGEANIIASVNSEEDSQGDLEDNSFGNAGDIKLEAKNIIQLQDRATISVDGGKDGGSGNINLTANRIDLSDRSQVSAQVEQGDEGNIILTANSLFLDDLAQVTTNATNNSIGGNIAIALDDNLVAKGNSRIVSNAVAGRGGNIFIQTRGLFLASDRTIEASSEFGIDGSIRVDTFDVDSASGLIPLPNNPIDSSQYLTTGCGLRNNYSFVDIGRGGLPASPIREVTQNDLLPDFTTKDSADLTKFSRESKMTNRDRPSFPERSIVEVATWKINQQGNVELIANSASLDISSLANNNSQCLQRVSK